MTLNVPIEGLAPAPMFADALRNGVDTTAQTVKEQVSFTTGLLINVSPPPPPPPSTAVCNPMCANGGTCYILHECMCAEGWVGGSCIEGIDTQNHKTSQNSVFQLSALKAVPMVGPVYSQETADVQSSGRGTTVHNVRPSPHTDTIIAVYKTCRHDTIVSCLHVLYTAICSPPCDNGECTAPDTCVCVEGWDGSTCDQGETIQRWLHYTILWVHLTQLYATLPVKMVAHVLSQETAHVWMDGQETPAPKVKVGK